jgi:hypothetical protein
MTGGSCPSEEQISRALTSSVDAGVLQHAASCVDRQATHERLMAAIQRARELPSDIPRPSRRDEVRTGLLAMAAVEPIALTRKAPGLVAFGVAAVALVALVLSLTRGRGDPPTPHSRVVVRAGVGARYQVSHPPWEIVRLWEGTVDLDVEPLGPGERVLVRVGDGEVEVRGTSFRVTAHDDRLVAVDVAHGRVEVRPTGGEIKVLRAGQIWRVRAPGDAPSAAPTISLELGALEPAESRPRRRARTRHADLPVAAAVALALRPTEQERLYDDAWDALRSGRFGQASREFGQVLSESPGGPLADEAAFWRATSLARSGDSPRAIEAFRHFVKEYRSSLRRGSASTILAWLLLKAHRPDEAAPLFRAAIDDPDESVRLSARDGFAAIAKH